MEGEWITERQAKYRISLNGGIGGGDGCPAKGN